MSLLPGARVGSYDVVEQIGAGGMGEVYRARDHRLDREVALKVLPPMLAGDEERLARLQREARTLAALNHPHIAQIHGLEESGGVTALVLELVDGVTLADLIARGPIPLEEALPLARQIADALEAAHEQGIVHRDLKPANVKVRSDGSVKVLDFGLARAADPAGGLDSSRLPTLTSPAMMTGAGVVLGTAAYMAPEQAKGRPVDRRADIWAFGVVLAEMLSGRAMFGGGSVTETLASVMRDEPAIPDAPPAIRQLLRRCLERDPRRRLRDIGEARIVLEDPIAADSGRGGVRPGGPSRRTWAWTAAAVVLTSIVAAAAIWGRPSRSADEARLRKFTLAVEGLQAGAQRSPQVSPDGSRMVYVRDGRLVIRDFASLEPRELSTAEDPRYPAWSPDSSQLAYIAGDRIWKLPVAGGAPSVVTVLRQPLGNGVGLAWTREGTIVLTTAIPGTGLQQVSSGGGDLTTLLTPEAPMEADFHEVSVLPDGRGLLYALDRGSGVVDTIVAFAGGTKKTLLHLQNESLRAPVYAATGHILYERTTNNAGIWAFPFSLSTLQATGEPFLVAPQSASHSVSRDGMLLYLPTAPPPPSELIVVNAEGKIESTIGQPYAGLANPHVSHDGRRVAVSAPTNARLDVWVYDVMRGNRARVTFGEGDEQAYAWSPSDDRVFFGQRIPPAQSRTIAEQAVDGTGSARELVASRNALALDVSPDNKFLAYADGGREPAKTGQDLWYVNLAGDRKPTLFLEAPTAQGDPRFSPDGRFLAFVSNESGRGEVYLKPFPKGDGKWQVSVNGGTAPRWSARGDALFFIEPGLESKALVASIALTPGLTIDTPRVLFTTSTIGRRLAGVGWDVFPDGKRFVVIGEVLGNERPTPTITIVENWLAEFRTRH